MLAFLRLIVELARFHQYISAAKIPVILVVPIIPFIQAFRLFQLFMPFWLAGLLSHFGSSVVPITPVIPGPCTMHIFEERGNKCIVRVKVRTNEKCRGSRRRKMIGICYIVLNLFPFPLCYSWLNRQWPIIALMLQTILHQYIGAANTKKISDIWVLVLPVWYYLPIGGTYMSTVTVTTSTLVEQCQLHQYVGGNICSKFLKSVSILNTQCSAMLAAPIIGHDLIITLFGVQF